MDQVVHRHILSRFPPDVYNREVSAAAGVMTEFAFRQLCLERTRVMEALEAVDVPSMEGFRKVSRALASVTTAAKAVEHAWANVKNSESVGRVHNLKTRSDLKSDMDSAFKIMNALMIDRRALQTHLSTELASQRQGLVAGCMVIAGREVRESKDRIALFKEQISVLEK